MTDNSKCCGLPLADSGYCVNNPWHEQAAETTDPVIPPEALEAVARQVFFAKHGLDWDFVWFAEEKRAKARQDASEFALIGLQAALPHLRPPVEVGTSGLREALERTLGSLPVMTYDTVHHLDPGYRTQALPKAQLLDLMALHPADDEAETKALCETATQVGLELGRQEAAEEIAAKCLRRAQLAERVPEGERSGVREGMVLTWLAAERLAREVATRTADARTAPSGHTDLPPTPDALSNRLPACPGCGQDGTGLESHRKDCNRLPEETGKGGS